MWSPTLSREDLQCIIRDFDWTLSETADLTSDTLRNGKKRFADCEACRNGQVYSSPSKAVKHIHDEHIDCVALEHEERLYNDPCTVWIKHAAPELDPDATMTQAGQDFVDSLSKISRLINEIQWLVASTAKDAQTQTPRPRLPSSLVHAFETLLCFYILTAKKLSLINQTHNPTHKSRARAGALNLRLERAKLRCIKVDFKVVDLLDTAKKDILLEGTEDQAEDALGIRAVGAEFLIAAIITTIQNRSINLPEESTLHISAQSDLDIINMYKRYNDQIHFEASRRPQRRVFIAIHELREELDAIDMVIRARKDMFQWYKFQIKPESSELSYESRVRPYRFEERYIDEQCDRMEERHKELIRLRDKAIALNSHVGRMIEILEEDHGKAIRVFTVVTLFFLPM